MKLPILTFPDSRLRTVAKAVTEFNDELKTLADDMLETMYASHGIGLAATQVDRHIQLVVIDLQDGESGSALKFVNPRIEVLDAKKHAYEEGCLSVPEYREKVFRPQSIRLHAQDLDGKPFTLEAHGLLAVCIQHELDHLKGTVFVDKIPELKKAKFQKQYLQVRAGW